MPGSSLKQNHRSHAYEPATDQTATRLLKTVYSRETFNQVTTPFSRKACKAIAEAMKTLLCGCMPRAFGQDHITKLRMTRRRLLLRIAGFQHRQRTDHRPLHVERHGPSYGTHARASTCYPKISVLPSRVQHNGRATSDYLVLDSRHATTIGVAPTSF